MIQSWLYYLTNCILTNFTLVKHNFLLMGLIDKPLWIHNWAWSVLWWLLKKSSIVFIYQTSFPQVGCNTRSIFKQNTASLKLKFFFSETGCCMKVIKSPVFPTVYAYLERENKDSFFSQGHQHKLKCKQPHLGFQLCALRSFLTMVTIMPLVLKYFNQLMALCQIRENFVNKLSFVHDKTCYDTSNA